MENLITQGTKKIKNKLTENFELVIKAHNLSKEAIANNDIKKSLEVIKMHEKFLLNYVLFESEVLFALTKKPLAKNLRSTITFLIVMKELVAISNHAKKIASFGISEEKVLADSSKKRVRKIHKPVRGMMTTVLEFLKTEDETLVDEIIKKEKTVNKAATSLRNEIIESVTTKKDKQEIEQRLYMLNVINSQEKAGDHLISICELIIYIKTASHISLK